MGTPFVSVNPSIPSYTRLTLTTLTQQQALYVPSPAPSPISWAIPGVSPLNPHPASTPLSNITTFHTIPINNTQTCRTISSLSVSLSNPYKSPTPFQSSPGFVFQTTHHDTHPRLLLRHRRRRRPRGSAPLNPACAPQPGATRHGAGDGHLARHQLAHDALRAARRVEIIIPLD